MVEFDPSVSSGLRGKRLCLVSHLDFNILRFRSVYIREALRAGMDLHVAVPPGRYRKSLEGLGATVHDLRIERRGGAWRALTASTDQDDETFRRISPDVVQVFTLLPIVTFARTRAARRVPWIATVTGLGSMYVGTGVRARLRQRMADVVLRRSMKRSARVIVQNPDDEAHLVGSGIVESERCERIVGSGVDLDEFDRSPAVEARARDLRRKHGIGEDDVVFTMVARLLRAKGVEIFAELSRRFCGRARFVLVGDVDPGNPDSVTAEEVARWREESSLVAPGHDDDVHAWLVASDVFVLPTRYREGVPRTIQEALACSLPVLVSDGPGCRETVDEGRNGRLIDPGNLEDWCRAVEEILVDVTKRRRWSEVSREIALSRFDARDVASRFLGVVASVLEPPRSDGRST